MFRLFYFTISISFLGFAVAQYFPPTPQGNTVLRSKFHPNVNISYKETFICETTPNVKSYSGYVHLPPNISADVHESQNYNINYFFWFFESRTDPANAPLAIWLDGGPGASSIVGAVSENGPCSINDDSNSTTLNPWSWNNHVNMLYIDQPVQVGYSYDFLVNGTVDQTTGNIQVSDFKHGIPEANNTFFVGTFASQIQNNTANSTVNGVHALWHFAQTWFAEFPAYKPKNDKIHLWAQSYGGRYGRYGRYGRTYVSFFEEQNLKIQNGSLKENGAYYMYLDTLGIINGCIDLLSQSSAYPHIAYNNTYGLQIINRAVYNQAVLDNIEPGGCIDQIHTCQSLAAQGDPNNYGNNVTVNAACLGADNFCQNYVAGPFFEYSSRFGHEIAVQGAIPFPTPYSLGFFNRHWVQAALGVPVNFTSVSAAVANAFISTGDFARGGIMSDLGSLLDKGIKVALMYGDRDYDCSWLGGENVSLSVKYAQSDQFAQAGYQPIITNATYTGGLVRQYGNFSFSRVFEAGHEVPAYQPATAYAIFNRATFNTDIPTGLTSSNPSNGVYRTHGPASSWPVKNKLPVEPKARCYIWDLSTCTDEQVWALLEGTATVRNFFVVG